MNWASQKTDVPFSTTPFKQAHDFLRRHAPQKRLVLSGWGGVARHFAHFHKELPGDIIFSSLNDNLGWDPVSEVYGKLEDRERWAIPWLEDDPAMWLPQFHVYRNCEYIDGNAPARKATCRNLRYCTATPPPPPDREHLVRKLDFVFVNQPAALGGVGLREKDNVEFNPSLPGQHVKDRNAIGRDDFCNQCNPDGFSQDGTRHGSVGRESVGHESDSR